MGPDDGYDGLSSVQVNAISPTKGAETFTPKTYNQTISSGRWLTGTQTIKGDANLVSSNIKSGVSIFGVSGSYSGTAQYKIQYFSDKLSNSSTEMRISVDSDVWYIAAFAIKSDSLINNWTDPGIFSLMWWDDGTEYGNGNRWERTSMGGATSAAAANIQKPVEIGGTSPNKYARLISRVSNGWASGFTYTGFLVCRV